MKTFENHQEYRSNAKEYLMALSHNLSYVHLLDPAGKPYYSLVSWLLENESTLGDEDSTIPAIKEIASIFKTDGQRVTKWLKEIYDDILELNWNHPDKFVKDGQYFCQLSLEYHCVIASFYIGLDIMPRVTDNFMFWFIQPKIGGCTFYVELIKHEIENGKHNIVIFLTSDPPNLYFQLLKDKALLRHDISILDDIWFKKSQLRQKLLKIYSHL